MKRNVSAKTIENVKKWLGKTGIDFFKGIKEKHGRIDAVWMEDGIPHPVHFREGMQVRNQLRTTKECKEWNAHDFDASWVQVIEEAKQNVMGKD